MRQDGASYEEISKRGGGILHTMKKTRECSKEILFKESCKKIEQIHSYGIGSIEIKSGYALSYEKELEVSILIKKLKEKYSPKIQIKNTFLAAHSVPKEFSSSQEYLNSIVLPLMKELNKKK